MISYSEKRGCTTGTCELYQRCRCSPTGRNTDWCIIVRYCPWCGRKEALHPEKLTYKQKDWLNRYNKKILDNLILEKEKNNESKQFCSK